MRAREFIIENVQPPEALKKKLVYGDWNFDVAIDGAQVSVLVLQDPGDYDSQIAYVVLDRDGRNLYPGDLWVKTSLHRRGIASSMYDYLKGLGFRIHRIPKDQLSAGKKFWQKHRGNEKVWEDELDEAWQKSGDHYTDMAYKLGSEQKLSLLGKGHKGSVYTHATEDNMVVKIFANDRGYAEWLKWSLNNQDNRYVPRIIPHPDGSIIKLYKYYKQGTRTISQRIGVVHLEKLQEISNDELFEFSKQVISYLDKPGFDRVTAKFRKIPEPSYFELLTSADWHVISLNADTGGDGDLSNVADFFSRHKYGFKTDLDLHLKNIMRRANGQLVFVDPLVGGF